MKSRYLGYYLAGRIFLGSFLVNIVPEIGFFGFVEKYWWWLIVTSISYFTYWYLQGYEEKIYQQLRKVLWISNGYLALHLFFRPLLNIEPALFLLLGVIVGLMWYLSKLHIKYKRPWYTIGSSSSFLILISGLFYLYPEKPDIEGFINQQQTQLIVTSPTTQPPRQAYIKVVNLETQTEKELFFQTGTQFFSVPNQYQLSYISNNSHNTAEIFLLFPDGNLLQLFPQSAIRFQEEIISEAGSFLEYNTIWTENNNNDTYLSITHFYRKNFQTHLTQQIGLTFTASPTIQHINKKLLSYLVKIFPGFFEYNMENAQQFTYYFSLFNENNSLLNETKYLISPEITIDISLWSQIKKNMQLAFPLLKSF